MSINCGIVGLPNVGKSTLFNALTQAGISADNFPFCTIEPNTGIVPIRDLRLDAIASIVNPQKIIPTTVEFVDIAGLVKGASKGEGLGNQFLANIRQTHAIAHVVRCFEDDNIVHVDNAINPEADIEIINTELALADLETVEKQLQKSQRNAKSGDKEAMALTQLLARLQTQLNEAKPVRRLSFTDQELAMLKPLHLLTMKPTMYIANINDNGIDNNPYLDAVTRIASDENAMVVPVCNQLEAEISELNEDERLEFLADMGLQETGLDRVVKCAYQLLGLQTFFTAGKQEVRAWTVKQGASAPNGAGVIHTDFERGFIRAEVIGYDDYIAHRGEQGSKDAGKWRLEGKDYRLNEGDIVHFRFNV